MKKKHILRKVLSVGMSTVIMTVSLLSGVSSAAVFEDLQDEIVLSDFSESFENEQIFESVEEEQIEDAATFEEIADEESETDDDAVVIEDVSVVSVPLEYVTVVLPQDIAEHTLLMDEEGINWFLQAENYYDNAGGKVFGLAKYDKNDTISLEKYMVLAEDSEYQYIWLEASEVQFSENYRIEYAQMASSLESIRTNLIWNEGIQVYDEPIVVDGSIVAYDEVFVEEIESEEEISASVLSITQQPSTVYGAIGDMAQYTVKASGDGLTYQWYVSTKGSTWLKITSTTGYNTPTLKVKITDARNGYYYRCEVKDNNGAVKTSSAARLFVKNELAINEQPATVSGKVGTTATFHVGATGDGLQYQWYLSTKGTTWVKITSTAGYDTDTLNMVIKDTRDGYYYRCEVTDQYGNVVNSDPARLFVNNKVNIVSQPQSVNGYVGEVAEFHVDAMGDGLQYQWYLSTKGTTWVKITSTAGYDTDTIRITIKDARDGYYYRCVVTDSNQTTATSDAARLTVKKGIEITEQPVDVTGKNGEIAVYHVAATGTDLSYQWYISTKGTTWVKITSTPGYDTDTLNMPIKTTRNGYYYRCEITDKAGNVVTSDAARMVVLSGPVITTQPKDVTGNVGKTAVFKVIAEGTGLTYQWYISTKGTTWAKITTNGTTNTLNVPIKASKNGFYYRCEVTDGTGTTVTSDAARLYACTELKITKEPESVTGKVNDTATFKVTAEGDDLTYQWYLSTKGVTWTKITSTAGYNTDTLNVVIKEARNGYQYRCEVTDKYNNTVTSQAAMITVAESFETGAYFFDANGNKIAEMEAVYFSGAAGLPAGMVVYIPRNSIETSNRYYTYSCNGAPMNLEAVVEGYSATESDLNLFFYVEEGKTNITVNAI